MPRLEPSRTIRILVAGVTLIALTLHARPAVRALGHRTATHARQTVWRRCSRNWRDGESERVTSRDPNILPDPCAKIRSTVEIFDSISGRTLVFIGDPND